MSKASPKKAGSPKCRGCGGLLEGKAMAIIAHKKWHKECAEKMGKKIPKEYNK